MTSVTVAQISEFSFIFAAVGLSAGLIDESILSLITVVGLITIGVSSYMILYNEGLYERVRTPGSFQGRSALPKQRMKKLNPPLSGHVIVVGMNAMGRRLVEDLHQRGETVLAIDTDIRKLADLPGHSLVGSVDYPSVLEEASLARAKLVVSTLRIEDSNNWLAYQSKRLTCPSPFMPSIHLSLMIYNDWALIF
jgi:hypothetical protein